MAYAFVNAHTFAAAGDNSRADSASIDTSGDTFWLVAVSDFQTAAACTVSDNQTGNTWNPRTAYEIAGGTRTRWNWCRPIDVGAGTVFSAVGAGSNYPGCVLFRFTGEAASPFDKESGTSSGGAASLQPGSITPATGEDDELSVVAVGFGAAATISTPTSGYSAVSQVNFTGGTNFGCAAAYRIKTTEDAENPQMDASSGTPIQSIASALFMAGVGGGGTLSWLPQTRSVQGTKSGVVSSGFTPGTIVQEAA
jgi:hypothetical protein